MYVCTPLSAYGVCVCVCVLCACVCVCVCCVHVCVCVCVVCMCVCVCVLCACVCVCVCCVHVCACVCVVCMCVCVCVVCVLRALYVPGFPSYGSSMTMSPGLCARVLVELNPTLPLAPFFDSILSVSCTYI